MSQHDLTIDNQGFPAFRADLNNALQALGSTQSGTTAPSPAFANQLWYDTTNNILKIRNEDNDAWISVVTLDQSADVTSGVGAKTLPTGDLVGTSDSQTLTNKTINASQLVDASVTPEKLSTNAQYTGFKNRIINGAMVIDQRNAGASVTQNTSTQYVTDRFGVYGSVTSKCTVQQSSTAPTGFNNSLIVTSSSAYTVGAAETFFLTQIIEGFNTADLGFGTANAKTVTLSFWVRSSLTGTFGGSLMNNAYDRSYPFSYTISVANTWEQKSITIAGDTTGTWVGATNGVGLRVHWSLGTGSTLSATAGSWVGAEEYSATGATSVVGTNGATWFVTGVQLEVGSTATSFDYRPYELALCQRYYFRNTASATNRMLSAGGQCYATSGIVANIVFPVPMRIAPTALEQTGTAGDYAVWNSSTSNVNCSSVVQFNGAYIYIGRVEAIVASGLVAGNATSLLSSGTGSNAFLGWSAEL